MNVTKYELLSPVFPQINKLDIDIILNFVTFFESWQSVYKFLIYICYGSLSCGTNLKLRVLNLDTLSNCDQTLRNTAGSLWHLVLIRASSDVSWYIFIQCINSSCCPLSYPFSLWQNILTLLLASMTLSEVWEQSAVCPVSEQESAFLE